LGCLIFRLDRVLMAVTLVVMMMILIVIVMVTIQWVARMELCSSSSGVDSLIMWDQRIAGCGEDVTAIGIWLMQDHYYMCLWFYYCTSA